MIEQRRLQPSVSAPAQCVGSGPARAAQWQDSLVLGHHSLALKSHSLALDHSLTLMPHSLVLMPNSLALMPHSLVLMHHSQSLALSEHSLALPGLMPQPAGMSAWGGGGLMRELGYTPVSRGEAVYIRSFAFQGHQGNRFTSYVWVGHVVRAGHVERLDGWAPVEVLGPQVFDLDAASSAEVEEALEAKEAVEASKDLQAGDGEAHDAREEDTLAADERDKWTDYFGLD